MVYGCFYHIKDLIGFYKLIYQSNFLKIILIKELNLFEDNLFSKQIDIKNCIFELFSVLIIYRNIINGSLRA